MPGVNRENKDRVFRMIFGYEKYKENLLSLFNALNDTNYTNVDDLEIDTLDDVFYMKMKNDVSCIIDSRLAVYEHQSTWSYNMPMRGFRYSAELYNKYIIKNNIDLFRRRLVKFPTPQYYVFYNGVEDKPEKEILKLSDAFSVPVKEGTFEWTAIVLNINYGHNKKLLKQCTILGDYAILISKIREFKQNTEDLKDAITKAIDYCIANDVLKEFLLEHRSEVVDMLRMEYDEAKTMAHIREDSYEEGELAGKKIGQEIGQKIGEKIGQQIGQQIGQELKLIEIVCKKLKKNKTAEQIADELEEKITDIEKIYAVAEKFAPDYDVNEIYEALRH